MDLKVEKIKKIFTVILAVIVSFLVVYALYCNKSRFYNPETVRYSKITIDEKTDLNNLIDSMSDNKIRDRFISEVKKINKISSLEPDSLYGRTLYIPVHEY